jgi:hypothetical protein
MKKIVGFLLVAFICNVVIAQEDSKKGKPDIPGTLLIDFGFNVLNNAPDLMETKFIGSKSINLYYQYDIPFGESKFSFHPGIGIGTDKYSFSEPVVLTSSISATGDKTIVINQFSDEINVKKSQLVVNYLDIPIEFRLYTNPFDKSRSFKFGLGARLGLRIGSHNKVKTSFEGNAQKTKLHDEFDLSKIRYGATARIGIGWFNLFYYHNMSDLFQSSKGVTPDTAISGYTIGLTIAGF